MASTTQHFHFLQPAPTPNATHPIHHGTRILAAEPRRAGHPNPPINSEAEFLRRFDKVHHRLGRAYVSTKSLYRKAKGLYKEKKRLWRILEQSHNNPEEYMRISKKYNKAAHHLAELKPEFTPNNVASEIWKEMTHPTYVFESIDPHLGLRHQNPYENYTL